MLLPGHSDLASAALAGFPKFARRLRGALLYALLVQALHPPAASGQERAGISVTPPTLTTPATVAVRGVLADKAFDELMRNGFPVRVHVRTELWRTGRVFDDVAANATWDIIVQFDTYDSNYEVLRVTSDAVTTLGVYAKLADARAAAELPYAPPLPIPPRGRESYVAVQADVQTLEMSDLEEVQRWLRGEVRPAVEGRKNPGTALGRGLRSLFTRLLGAEVRHLEGRTRRFTLR